MLEDGLEVQHPSVSRVEPSGTDVCERPGSRRVARLVALVGVHSLTSSVVRRAGDPSGLAVPGAGRRPHHKVVQRQGRDRGVTRVSPNRRPAMLPERKLQYDSREPPLDDSIVQRPLNLQSEVPAVKGTVKWFNNDKGFGFI